MTKRFPSGPPLHTSFRRSDKASFVLVPHDVSLSLPSTIPTPPFLRSYLPRLCPENSLDGFAVVCGGAGLETRWGEGGHDHDVRVPYSKQSESRLELLAAARRSEIKAARCALRACVLSAVKAVEKKNGGWKNLVANSTPGAKPKTRRRSPKKHAAHSPFERTTTNAHRR